MRRGRGFGELAPGQDRVLRAGSSSETATRRVRGSMANNLRSSSPRMSGQPQAGSDRVQGRTPIGSRWAASSTGSRSEAGDGARPVVGLQGTAPEGGLTATADCLPVYAPARIVVVGRRILRCLCFGFGLRVCDQHVGHRGLSATFRPLDAPEVEVPVPSVDRHCQTGHQVLTVSILGRLPGQDADRHLITDSGHQSTVGELSVATLRAGSLLVVGEEPAAVGPLVHPAVHVGVVPVGPHTQRVPRSLGL